MFWESLLSGLLSIGAIPSDWYATRRVIEQHFSEATHTVDDKRSPTVVEEDKKTTKFVAKPKKGTKEEPKKPMTRKTPVKKRSPKKTPVKNHTQEMHASKSRADKCSCCAHYLQCSEVVNFGKKKTVNIFAKDVLSDSSDEEVSIKNKRELSSRHSYHVNYYTDSSEDDK